MANIGVHNRIQGLYIPPSYGAYAQDLSSAVVTYRYALLVRVRTTGRLWDRG